MNSSPEPTPLPRGKEIAPTKLPLPVRKTRYFVGGLLIVLIISVVTSTYLRIEQQLQNTLEGHLKALLGENVHQVESRLLKRGTFTTQAAEFKSLRVLVSELGKESTSHAPTQKKLRELFTPLRDTNIISQAHIFNPRGEIIWQLHKGINFEVPKARLLQANNGFPQVYAQRLSSEQSIVSIARIGRRNHLLGYLVFTIDTISIFHSPEKHTHRTGASYVFDRSGILANFQENNLAKAWNPREIFNIEEETQHHAVETPPKQYRGLEGKKVIGAALWLSDFNLGVATELQLATAFRSTALLRQSFLVLVTLVGAAILGFIALGRWSLRMREESLLMTKRLGRLARAIQPLSAALEHDPSAVVLIDDDGKVVYANAASHRVLKTEGPLLAQDAETVFQSLNADLKEALISGRDSIVAQGADSKEETLLVSSHSVSIEGVPHFLYMLRPITQQVRRQEVEHWKKLIRVMSHELNNALAPITSLLSSARTVNQMTHQDPRLGKIFESISERTRHLLTFLEGYRELAQLPRPAPRETDWNSFLAGLHSQSAFQSNSPTPERPGHFDPAQIERMLLNILKNAQEAGSSTEDIEISIFDTGEGFRLQVQDRGRGMPEAVLRQAMLPFFSTKRTGTGVGLALAREIIEAHGGQLTLANREQGGLIVSCFIPHPVAPPPSRGSVTRIPIRKSTIDTHT